MKYNTFFMTVMAAIFAMASVNANAQNHRMHDNRAGYNEMHMTGHAPAPQHHDYQVQGGRYGYGDRYEAPRHEPLSRGAYRYEGPAPRFDRHGYLPGWEGRVRFHNGRYGYLRDNRWYWYDTYFAPDYYYAHPHTHFHAHLLSPGARAVVGAVAGTAIVAGIISALVR